MQQTLNMHT